MLPVINVVGVACSYSGSGT